MTNLIIEIQSDSPNLSKFAQIQGVSLNLEFKQLQITGVYYYVDSNQLKLKADQASFNLTVPSLNSGNTSPLSDDTISGVLTALEKECAQALVAAGQTLKTP